MTQTHTSYELSKRLKEFMGDSAPEPMAGEIYVIRWARPIIEPAEKFPNEKGVLPAYQLHDLLSPAFCEAMAIKCKIFGPKWCASELGYAYYNGGLSDVEKVLMDMMEGK